MSTVHSTNEENVTRVPKINIVLPRNTSDPPASTRSVNTSVPKRTSFKIREFCKRCFVCKKYPREIEIYEYNFMFCYSDCLKDKMYKDAKENYFEVKNKKTCRKDNTPKKFITGKVEE